MERIRNLVKKFWPVVLLVLLLVILQWHLITSWSPLLVCLLSLTVVVVGAYWVLHSPTVSIDKSLQDTHYERFRRLQGLYAAIAASARTDPITKDGAEEFERQAAKLEALVDAKARGFVSRNAENDVHNLYLIFLQIEPIDFLSLDIQTLENDYRQAAGIPAYLAYVGALLRNKPADPAWTPGENAQMLRADATFLVNETRRQDILKQHIEHTRQRLLRAAFRSWWWNVIPMLAVLIIYVFCESCISLPSLTNSPQAGKKDAAQVSDPKTAVSPAVDSDQWKKAFVGSYLLGEPGEHALEKPPQKGYTTLYQIIVLSALLSLVGIAGASGGLMSVIQRIQSGTSDSDPGTELRALSLAETSVFFAPVSGLIFAVVLSLIFASRAINGTLFPDISTPFWYYTLWNAPEMAKWMLWAFIAGFSERLVPDMLDTLTKKSEASGKAADSSGAATTSAQPNVQRKAGAAANARDDRNGGISDKGPVLDPHPDTIPPDAIELTVTGKNFDQDTRMYVNAQPREVKERTATSLRVELADSDLQGPTIQVMAQNTSGANTGDSNTLKISVGDPGE
jgi:hypothetical protein